MIDDDLDRPDGVQQYVLTLGAELTRRGHDVHYVASTTRRVDLPLHVVGRNVGVTFNGNRLNTPLPASRAQVRDLLARVPFDVLHVQMPYSPVLAGRVVSAAAPGTAVVGTFHIYPHSWWVSAGTRALGLLEQRRLRRFRHVFATSQAAAQFAQPRRHRVGAIVKNGLGHMIDNQWTGSEGRLAHCIFFVEPAQGLVAVAPVIGNLKLGKNILFGHCIGHADIAHGHPGTNRVDARGAAIQPFGADILKFAIAA